MEEQENDYELILGAYIEEIGGKKIPLRNKILSDIDKNILENLRSLPNITEEDKKLITLILSPNLKIQEVEKKKITPKVITVKAVKNKFQQSISSEILVEDILDFTNMSSENMGKILGTYYSDPSFRLLYNKLSNVSCKYRKEAVQIILESIKGFYKIQSKNRFKNVKHPMDGILRDKIALSCLTLYLEFPDLNSIALKNLTGYSEEEVEKAISVINNFILKVKDVPEEQFHLSLKPLKKLEIINS